MRPKECPLAMKRLQARIPDSGEYSIRVTRDLKRNSQRAIFRPQNKTAPRSPVELSGTAYASVDEV